MEVEFTKAFLKDLSKVKNGDVSLRLEKAILKIEQAEGIFSLSNIKKINHNSGTYYRIRIGEYRLGFSLTEENTVLIHRFLHRSEIYRYFP